MTNDNHVLNYFLFLLKIGDLSLYPVYWWSGYSARTEFTKQLGITMRPPFFLEFSLIISIQINTWQNKGYKSKSQLLQPNSTSPELELDLIMGRNPPPTYQELLRHFQAT